MKLLEVNIDKLSDEEVLEHISSLGKEIENLAEERKELTQKVDVVIKTSRQYNVARTQAKRLLESRKVFRFRDELFAEYSNVSRDKLEKVWSKAWEHGHSAGLEEVRHYFEDFIDLVL